MQNYRPLTDATIVANAPEIINDNEKTIMTAFAAATPPTTNLVAGMTWYNITEKRTYHLEDDLETWTLDGAAKSTQEEALAGVNDTKFMTPASVKAAIDARVRHEFDSEGYLCLVYDDGEEEE